jgi:hypothetical protein
LKKCLLLRTSLYLEKQLLAGATGLQAAVFFHDGTRYQLPCSSAAVLKELSIVSRAVMLREHALARILEAVFIQMRIAQPPCICPLR